MGTTWIAVTVTAAPPLGEAVESVLLDLGAPGLQTEDTPEGTRITAHFADRAPLAALDAYLDELATRPGVMRPRVAVAEVTDDGWAENWKQHFPGLAVGARLFIHPPWIAAIPTGRVGILLDPGMAFGTGHHASTRGCLELLEPALAARPNAAILDIGCGSGILAIAAIKLGARRAVAIDIDPDACAIARDNAAVNGVAAAIAFGEDVATVTAHSDVVLANMFARQLVEMADLIAARVAPGGIAIGAGILASEADAVRAAWRDAGLLADGEWSDEGWVALAFRRPA
ncbi:MAG: 50S ribosomal protein L11 methyltransferase [Deltaproteobacteria bacterium]|nr:50S ribosomal protein L11 methyltransferase [Deltaproteobacteria bacterium]